MDKVVIEEIKKGKRKIWEDKWAKRIKKLGMITDITVIKITKMFVKSKIYYNMDSNSCQRGRR
jgi:hypothetical protein